MANILTKKRFIDELNFYISFHFDDDTCIDIINDYEEWFDNEISNGKTEQQICVALDSPRRTAHNLVIESKNIANYKLRFLHNSTFQSLCVSVIHILFGVLLVNHYNKNGFNFFLPALFINFLLFFIDMSIARKTISIQVKSKVNLLFSCIFLLVMLLEVFTVHTCYYNYIGKIYTSLATVFILILFLIDINIIAKRNLNKRLRVVTIFHISSIINILLFFINQLHLLHDSAYSYSTIYYSLCMYIQILALTFVLYKVKFNKVQ